MSFVLVWYQNADWNSTTVVLEFLGAQLQKNYTLRSRSRKKKKRNRDEENRDELNRDEPPLKGHSIVLKKPKAAYKLKTR